MSMTEVQVGDEIIEFPEHMTDDEITGALAKLYPPEEPKEWTPVSDFVEGVREDFGERDLALSDTIGSLMGEDQGPNVRPLYSEDNNVLQNAAGSVEGLAQGAGNIVGRAADVVGGAVSAAIPPGVKDYASGKVDAFLDTSLGQNILSALQKGGSAAAAVQEKYPQEVKSVMGALEAGTLLTPTGKIADKASDIGTSMYRSGAAQRRNQVAEKLLSPPHKLGKGDTIEGSTLKGRKRHYVPTEYDKEVAQQVADIPDVKPGRSAAYNNQAVVNEARDMRASLDAQLRKAGNPDIDTDALQIELMDMVDNIGDLDEALTLSGPAEGFAKKILEKAQQLIEDSDGTTLGILDARRKLDQWVESNSGAGYDPDIINGRNVAQKLIRDKINLTVSDAVPDVGVKESLRAQSNLWTASDTLQDKIKIEAESALGRVVQGIGQGHVGPVGAYAIASGVPTLAAALALPAGSAGLAGLTGAGVWTAYKTWDSATRKKVLGEMIRKVSSQMKTGSNVEQLKADRLLLLDMLQAEQQEEPIE